ncbi:S-layer homology domain-containing protein [Evtepia sp.]|uniref:S-layer homology domain-containing protein n=1 Tax=Evtepia sp. TaxID=2773933 RepID=UPI0039903FDC
MVGISSDAFQNEGTFTANISGAHKVYAVQTEDFTNTGTFTANISDASTACALYTGNFANSGALDVGFTGVGNGVGVQLIGGTSFENSGKIDIAIPDADSARGIGRYSTSGTQVDNDFSWTNTESGVITIDVSGEGNATAALGGQTLAGMDLRSGEDITFTNHGTITATAASNGPAALKETNWPSWQYFDTLGILLLCDEGTFTNTGDMKLTALNGYTAGISIGGTNDYDISITNSGNLNITTTTKGGDNIRSVGIYAQIPGIESGAARELPFNTTGGTVSISTSAVDGSTVDSGKLMAICLVQTFTAGTTVPSDTGAFQQITGEGMALSGQPVVLKVENDGKNQTAFINTIGTVSEDGTVTPATDMTVVPSITGTVTIQGTPQVGSTLTAQVSGLPDGVSVTYQWQAADSAEGPFTNIQGATESTYTPTNDQVGQYLRVVVKPVGEDYGGALTATTTQAVVKPYIPPANPNYKITVEATQGGTVVVTPTSAKAGTTVTLTPVPDQGFALDTLTVTDRFGDAVRVTEQADGTHTFTMPNGQVTVTATFTETAPEPLPFTDVAEGDWFYDAVRYAYENGLMDGVGGNRFAPNSATTRAQLVTILYRLEGQPAVSGDLPFTDVETGTWYTNAVLWAAQNNIVNGVSDTEFAPGDDLTRQQLVTILYRYAEAKGYDVSASADLSGYPDAGQVQDYAQPAMAWAVAEGIVEGMDGNLNPAGNASRAQIATILMRFCEDAAQ